MTLNTPTRTYPTEDAAHRRVQELVASDGVWPAVIGMGDGTFALSFDPVTSKRDLVSA